MPPKTRDTCTIFLTRGFESRLQGLTGKQADRVGRRVSSVSERRVLSSGMHKILWWRQRVGQLSVGTPISLHTLSPFILSSPFLLRYRSYLPIGWPSRANSLSPRLSLFLTAADREAGERAGRYVHFYALIYAHTCTLKIIPYRS